MIGATGVTKLADDAGNGAIKNMKQKQKETNRDAKNNIKDDVAAEKNLIVHAAPKVKHDAGADLNTNHHHNAKGSVGGSVGGGINANLDAKVDAKMDAKIDAELEVDGDADAEARMKRQDAHQDREDRKDAERAKLNKQRKKDNER